MVSRPVLIFGITVFAAIVFSYGLTKYQAPHAQELGGGAQSGSSGQLGGGSSGAYRPGETCDQALKKETGRAICVHTDEELFTAQEDGKVETNLKAIRSIKAQVHYVNSETSNEKATDLNGNAVIPLDPGNTPDAITITTESPYYIRSPRKKSAPDTTDTLPYKSNTTVYNFKVSRPTVVGVITSKLDRNWETCVDVPTNGDAQSAPFCNYSPCFAFPLEYATLTSAKDKFNFKISGLKSGDRFSLARSDDTSHTISAAPPDKDNTNERWFDNIDFKMTGADGKNGYVNLALTISNPVDKSTRSIPCSHPTTGSGSVPGRGGSNGGGGTNAGGGSGGSAGNNGSNNQEGGGANNGGGGTNAGGGSAGGGSQPGSGGKPGAKPGGKPGSKPGTKPGGNPSGKPGINPNIQPSSGPGKGGPGGCPSSPGNQNTIQKVWSALVTFVEKLFGLGGGGCNNPGGPPGPQPSGSNPPFPNPSNTLCPVVAPHSLNPQNGSSCGLPIATPKPTTSSSPSATVLIGAGNIVGPNATPQYEATQKMIENELKANANLTIFPLGNLDGLFDNFREYDRTWGSNGKKALTKPALGAEEYVVPKAKVYFDYFTDEDVQGPDKLGYYSYDLGGWHVIVLNSNCTQAGIGESGCDDHSSQMKWLKQDLSDHADACTLAYWYDPITTAGQGMPDTGKFLQLTPLWNAMVGKVSVAIMGRYHYYARFKPLGTDRKADDKGIVPIIIGTGGNSIPEGVNPGTPNLDKGIGGNLGLLKLTLDGSSYSGTYSGVPYTSPADKPQTLDTFSGQCQK